MARTWPSIRVDLIEGHGEQYRPRPGRIFTAARHHTFKQLADAIDDAFACWDHSHLQEFTLADGRRLCDLIFHRSGLTGGPTAAGRGEGSRCCSQAPAGQAITHLASPEPAHAAAGARAEHPDPHHLEAIPSGQTDVHNGGSARHR